MKILQIFLVVVFVIILSFFSLLILAGTDSTDRRSRVPSDMNSISSAVRSFRLNAGHYPTTEQGLEALDTRPETKPLPKKWVQVLEGMPIDPWGRKYRYRTLPGGDARGFEIRSAGPDGIDGTKDDLSSLDPVG